MSDDYEANTGTTGTVSVGGSATGIIERARDRDWFAVELVAGRTYVIDLEGADTGAGTLANAMLWGLFDGAGNRVARREHNGSEGGNARLIHTATEDGTHYIAARGFRMDDTGTYTVRVRDRDADPAPQPDTVTPVQNVAPQRATVPSDPDAVAAGAVDLGDLSALGRSGSRRQDSVDGTGDGTDYWRFSLSETQTVTLSLRRQDANADLYLEDGEGTVLASSAKGGARKDEIAATLAAGTYYVRVAAQEAGDNDYTLLARAADPQPRAEGQNAPQQQSVPASVSEPAGGDLPANTSTTGRVAVDGSATGAIGAPGEPNVFGPVTSRVWGDVDWFAVTLEKGKTYRIDLKGSHSGNGTLSDPILRGIHDSDGNLIAGTADDNSGVMYDARTYFTAPETATYYIAADSKEFKTYFMMAPLVYDLGTGTYTLSVTVGTPPQPVVPDESSLPTVSEPRGRDFDEDLVDHGQGWMIGRVAVGDAARGKMNRGYDRDTFAVYMEKGKTYRLEMEGEYTGGGTLDDPSLFGIFKWDGTPKGTRMPETQHDAGYVNTARVYFEAPETATYYVVVRSTSSDGKGTYKLSVAEAPDDYAADISTDGRIDVNGTATGEITLSRDVDWFKIELKAGKTYQVDLKGSLTDDGWLRDPFLRGIHDANGNLIPGTANDDVYRPQGDHGWNLSSRVFFTPDEDGTYYLAAGSPQYKSDITYYPRGTYTVVVTDTSTDDFAAGTGTTGTVEVGGSAAGRVETPDDRDWFAVVLEADTAYRFELTGSPSGGYALRDPKLHGIYDADGNLVAGTTDADGGEGNDSLMTFTAVRSGTYYVAAGADGVSPDITPDYYGWAAPGSSNPDAATEYFGPRGLEFAQLDNLGAYTLSVEHYDDAM